MSENTFLPLTIVARKHEERVQHYCVDSSVPNYPTQAYSRQSGSNALCRRLDRLRISSCWCSFVVGGRCDLRSVGHAAPERGRFPVVRPANPFRSRREPLRAGPGMAHSATLPKLHV